MLDIGLGRSQSDRPAMSDTHSADLRVTLGELPETLALRLAHGV